MRSERKASLSSTKRKKATKFNGLIVEKMYLDDLVPDYENARLHDERNIESIKASLLQFGQVEPLVVQRTTRKVIGGNGRFEAMQKIGWSECDVVLVDLDDRQAVALGITLNRTAELAEWNFEVLANTLRKLQESAVDLHSLGWEDFELQPLLLANWEQSDNLPNGSGMKSIPMTPQQMEIVMRAVEKVREQEDDSKISVGRALELICADYIA
jgi:hypothetical protein